MLTQTGLTVPGRPKPHGSHQQSTTTIWWSHLTQKADCALWVITRTVRKDNPMDQINPKSWLCPKGHHTNSPQQHSDGPCWHKQGWLCLKDLRPTGHHRNSLQQQSYGPNCPKIADCALRVIIQTVHNNILMDHFDTIRFECGRKT